MGGPKTIDCINQKYYNNGLDNIGNKDSFASYGKDIQWLIRSSKATK